ncbi:MAG: electron transfer flavoprotein subunit alpha/FixB family protein [Planctomycetales bacterium]
MTAGPIIGILIPDDATHAAELLGDAVELARPLGGCVAAWTFSEDPAHLRHLIALGADQVHATCGGIRGANHRLAAAQTWWNELRPRVVLASAAGDDRPLAARLAVRCGATLASPVLSVTARRGGIEITALSGDGRQARQIILADQESAIVTLRPGVGQPRQEIPDRSGPIHHLAVEPQPETVTLIERWSADPASTDIVHLPRLVAGGRGLGGREGFEFLRAVATHLGAGVAASRMAVDLGWIERERQVGQTGKRVKPELYLACGISGASHHREGMAESQHIIAINTDPAAPIFEIAHLGLVADWRPTLHEALSQIDPSPEPA